MYAELSVPILLKEQERINRALQNKMAPPIPFFFMTPQGRKLPPGHLPVCTDPACTCIGFEGEGAFDECMLQVANLSMEDPMMNRDHLIRICNGAFGGKQSTKSIHVVNDMALILCHDHARACEIQRVLISKGFTVGFNRHIGHRKVCNKRKCPCFCIVPEGRNPDEKPCDHVLYVKLTISNPKDPQRVAETLKKDMHPSLSTRLFVNPECTYAFITFQDSDTGHHWAARAQQTLTQKDYEVNFKFNPPPRTKVCKNHGCACFVPEKHAHCTEISGKVLYISLTDNNRKPIFKHIRSDIQKALGDRNRYVHLWINTHKAPYYALIGFEDHATAARGQDLLCAAFEEVYFDCEMLSKVDDE